MRTAIALAVGATGILAAASVAGPPAISTLVLEGDAVAGVGNVTTIDNLAVNDAGDWLVEADTDNPDTDADSVIIENGALRHRESDPILVPAGASIGLFDSLNLDDAGDIAWNLGLDGTSGSGDDTGIFHNLELVVQEGNGAFAPGLSPGTTYLGFFDVKNANGNRFVAVVTIDDPAIPSSADRALMLYEAPGMGFTQHVLVKEGDLLPGQTEVVADLETGPHESAFNDANTVLIGIDLDGATATDGTIYLVEVDPFDPDTATFTLLAQEGSEAVDPERDWLALSSPELDLNNAGQHVYTGRMTGDTATDTVIVRDGAIFRQEGDPVPGLDGSFSLTSFGSGPVWIDDSGNVLWYGDWDDPNTDVDTGLFLNDTLLVQEGVTTIGGQVVDTLRGVQDGFVLSDNGRYVVFEAVLAGAIEGAFLIDLGPACVADLDGSGDVGFGDILEIIGAWGPCGEPCPEDLSGNGAVDFADILAVIAAWGPCM